MEACGHRELVIPMKKAILSLLAAAAVLPAHATSYSTWIAAYGLSGGDAAATADPDHDGVPNLMEYALDGLSPVVADANRPSMPRLCFMRRTGVGIGAWEFASYTTPPTNGYNGRWHTALRFVPRSGVEGIRYMPQVSDMGTLRRWFDGRSAIRSEAYPGNVVLSVCLVQGQRHKRMFMRLRVVQDARVGDALSGIAIGGLSAQSLDVSTATALQRVTSASSSSVVTTQDITVTRSVGSTAVTDYMWNWIPNAHNILPVSVTRSSSDNAVITPHPTDPYRWTWVSNGTATLRMATSSAVYTSAVTTSTATGATVDTYLSTTAGSLREHTETAVDALLAGKTASTALAIFSTQDHAGGTYTRNTSCWASGVDLTPISPWNSSGGAHNAGTLISPRHVLFASHYLPAAGSTIRFIKADNTVVTRTITAMQSLSDSQAYYPDLTVGVLNSDVPAGIDYARVLPDTWASYLPTLAVRPVPALSTDQEEKLTVREMTSLSVAPGNRVFFATPADPQRRAFYEDVVAGDSGNPAFLLVNNKLVLVTVWTGGGGGMGTHVAGFRTAVNAAMTALGGGYSLTNVDLTGITSY